MRASVPGLNGQTLLDVEGARACSLDPAAQHNANQPTGITPIKKTGVVGRDDALGNQGLETALVDDSVALVGDPASGPRPAVSAWRSW